MEYDVIVTYPRDITWYSFRPDRIIEDLARACKGKWIGQGFEAKENPDAKRDIQFSFGDKQNAELFKREIENLKKIEVVIRETEIK